MLAPATLDPTRIDPGRADTPRPDGRAARGELRCRTCGEIFPAEYLVCPKDATPLGGTTDADDPLLGCVLAGTYRVTRAIASGGMGRLYEADHVRLERRFAVKVIHDPYATHPDALARFEREARAAGRIRSDHVVDVVDVLRAPDGRPCIVAELLDGEDLQARIDRARKLPVSEALPIARQLCRGLAAAHAHGVVHRDLKPSNVFLASNPDGRVTAKILDFGVAKIADAPEITRSGAVVGTPAYMAPEQARGSSRADARADVYGVGAILYKMLTGKSPYAGEDATATLAKLLEKDPVRPRSLDPSIPEGVEAVVQRAMARDPAERFETALELERALAAFDAAGPDVQASASPSLPGSDSPVSIVLPGGSVPDAAGLTRAARRARPAAIAAAAGTTLALALAVSAILGGGAALASGGTDIGPGARWVLAVTTFAVAAAFAGLIARRLRHHWSSATALRPDTARLVRALLAALAILGTFELVTRAAAPFTATLLAPDALEGSLRILSATLLATATALLPSPR